METDILKYLPDWFGQVTDFRQLMDTQRLEMETLATAISQVRNNLFVVSAEESTIADWEQVFHILPNPANESLEFRRARILNRLASNPPFTLPSLYLKLDELMGVGKWNVLIDYASYTVYIEALAESQVWSQEISITLATMKPCHMVFTNRPVNINALQIKQTAASWMVRLNYVLGAWRLGDTAFMGAGKKEEYTMKKALQPALLQDIAMFAAQDVAQVRLNHEVVLSVFDTRKGTEGMSVIRYTVTPHMVAEVNCAELLNEAGEVLSVSKIYVPIKGATQFEHRIKIEC